MADGQKAYLQDKDGTNLLVASDWSMVQNKPGNLATTNQLPKLSGWKRDGLIYKNGAYDWDHVHNGYNCAYRVADMGSFKIVELRLVFGVSKDIVQDTECIELPAAIKPDGDEEIVQASGIRGVMIHLMPDLTVRIRCQQFGSGDKYTANGQLSFHTMYMTTL